MIQAVPICRAEILSQFPFLAELDENASVEAVFSWIEIHPERAYFVKAIEERNFKMKSPFEIVKEVCEDKQN
ncbi:hypothetical protein ABIE26_002991 [Pedobacter africanus]|uniref:hypothetical protein n=1 Tax=Pedobacter africanus TaxID=151894 RepID=UPI0033923B92